MTDLLSVVFLLGASLTDTPEVWILVLIGFVILFDFWVGLRKPYFLTFGLLQLAVVVSGYIWATGVAAKQDVSGPYAWAFVIGAWLIVTFLFHSIGLFVNIVSWCIKQSKHG